MRIVRTRDENYVWSGNFDQTSRDDLATESDIATAVTAQVQALLLTTK
jgi:TolB-like protein